MLTHAPEINLLGLVLQSGQVLVDGTELAAVLHFTHSQPLAPTTCAKHRNVNRKKSKYFVKHLKQSTIIHEKLNKTSM
jgi:hypothetical protein